MGCSDTLKGSIQQAASSGQLKEQDCWQHLQEVPAVVVTGRLGDAHAAVGWQVGHVRARCLCLHPQKSGLTHPQCGQQDLSACYVTQGCQGFHALLLHSKNSETLLLRQQLVQSTTRKTPRNSHVQQQQRIQGAQNTSALLTTLCEWL